MPGPIPKRDAMRRRRNPPAVETKTVEAAGRVRVPAADRGWHPIARAWYRSLAKSGQSRFFEPSDWATAWVVAESMSRELAPRVVGTTKEGEPVWAEVPPRAASMAAWRQMMAALLVTEGDRRRARVEIERIRDEEPAPVAEIDEYLVAVRDRLS